MLVPLNTKFTKHTSKVMSAVLSAIIMLAGSSLAAQDITAEQNDMEESGVSSPEVEVMSNGELRITPVFESHASRIAEGELIQSIFQNPDSVIGKQLQFESGKVVGEILNLQRKVEDLSLYLVVDATPFFNADVIYAVALKDISAVRDEVVLMPIADGMHLRGLTYFPEEYVAYDENFSDKRVDQIFEEAMSENESK